MKSMNTLYTFVIYLIFSFINHRHVQVGCDSTKIILKTFGKLIKANIVPPSSVGVDISREER